MKLHALIVLSAAMVAASNPCFAKSRIPPGSSPHAPTIFGYPLTAGVASGNGAKAVYSANISWSVNKTPGYILTNTGGADVTGWNFPSYASPKLYITQFYGAKIYIGSATNFGATPPFSIVVQTNDGVVHTCAGAKGTYRFTAANQQAAAYSSYEALGPQFTPPLGLGSSTINKAAFIYTGTGTVSLTSGVLVGNNQLVPGYYKYSTTPDTKLNFQP